jgi:hypothetical protein
MERHALGIPSAPLWVLVWALLAWPCRGEVVAIQGAGGSVASIDAKSGRYEIRSRQSELALAGTLGEAPSHVSVNAGRDRLGSYRELQFRWQHPIALRGSIRTYVDRPIALFGVTSTAPITDGSVLLFPRFTEFPRTLHRFSYRDQPFAPPSFALEENATPWLLFDEHDHAAILSPASDFMIASMHGNGEAEIASGLNNGIRTLPAGFTHWTVLAFGSRINRTWDTWGAALVDLQGAHRPPNDADTGLRYLGYWTDNGAAYYYDYDRALGYAETLEALVKRYRDEAIPIRYLQLDSWWYEKTLTGPDGQPGASKNPGLPAGEWNRFGGLLKYEADPALFPRGLAAFQKEIGLPLMVHNRWIDPASPYHQRYDISGFAAIDPQWWQDIMSYLAAAHVATYEQDWLSVIYEHSPALSTTLGVGDAFTGGMARAAEEHGLTLQYCMPLPRHLLQGARYANLTSARVAGDRFERAKWDDFLYTSRLASSLGIWPWTDVFMSAETDNLLIATLSAGLVGIGDRMGAEDRNSILRAVRLDGVIIKPDRPLLPIDAMYVADALQSGQPMVAAAHTDHGGLRTSYVFSYTRGASGRTRAAFTLQEVGVPRVAYVYEPRSGRARRMAPSQTVSVRLDQGTAYFVIVPVSRSGIALFGDADKFVPDGRKRITALADGPDKLTATVTFASEERSVRLFGYAPRRPTVTAQAGSVGKVTFDKTSERFEVQVSPGSELLRESPGGDPVQRAIIALELK